jgi:hypothetical protein
MAGLTTLELPMKSFLIDEIWHAERYRAIEILRATNRRNGDALPRYGGQIFNGLIPGTTSHSKVRDHPC